MNMQVTILTIDVPNEIYKAAKCGSEVLLILNNEVIGEGKAVAEREGVIAIEMRDDAAQTLVADSAMVKLWAEKFPEKKFKYSLFHFSAYTGEYLGENEDEYTPQVLMDVRVVDKFDLRYGMVPSSFKELPGYHAAMKENEDPDDECETDAGEESITPYLEMQSLDEEQPKEKALPEDPRDVRSRHRAILAIHDANRDNKK